jgi:hypothetical protein
MAAMLCGREAMDQLVQNLLSGEAEYSLAQLAQLEWLIEEQQERLRIQQRAREASF